MKKSEIIDHVCELVQDASGGMRALISHWVNLVLDDIASRIPLKALEREEITAVVEGQRDYDLPSDVDHVLKVFIPAWGTDGILKKRNNDEYIFQMLQDGMSFQGQPIYYNIFAQKTLRLHPPALAQYAPASPTTDEKIHLMMNRSITHLADDDDITELKMKHIPVIIWGAYSYGARFDSLGDIPDAEGKYERGIARLIGDQSFDLERPKVCPFIPC